MHKIPSDYRLDAIDDSYSDMKCVFWIRLRDTPLKNYRLSERLGIFVNVEHRECFDCLQPLLCLYVIGDVMTEIDYPSFAFLNA